MIGAVILYVDYGFWHERYLSDEKVAQVASTTEAKIESPGTMFSNFMKEAQTQFGTINESRKELLQGKEVYINDSK